MGSDMRVRAHGVMQPKWSTMLIFSSMLHFCAFALILLAPNVFPTREIRNSVYEVDLIDMPRKLGSPVRGAATEAPKAVPKPVPPEAPKAAPTPPPAVVKPPAPAPQPARAEPKVEKIVPLEKQPEKVVPIAKRTVEKEVKPDKAPEVPPDKLIDQALKRVEKQAAEKKPGPAGAASMRTSKNGAVSASSRIDNAVARLEKQLGEAAGTGEQGGGAPADGMSMRIYEMEVHNRIKSNWSFPVALTSPQTRDLEAVLLVRVKADGTVLDVAVKTRSANAVFDQSALKAVERSNPLPPFPEGYQKTSEEFEIRFNLSELEGN